MGTDTVIILDPTDLTVCIVGTAYAGEIKKSAFSLCNYLLPEKGIFPMHASANCREGGKQSSVLFGLFAVYLALSENDLLAIRTSSGALTFVSVGTTAFSFCSPSLGPTSTILTLFGHDEMGRMRRVHGDRALPRAATRRNRLAGICTMTEA